jgi:hypothetical protein
MIAAVAYTALTAALILLVEHWLPWKMILGREISRVWAYIAGVLAMVLPLSGLYLYWIDRSPVYPYAHLVALWVVIGVSGLAVISAYQFDALIARLALLRELQERQAREESEFGWTIEEEE